ncbi:hypothetical protein JCM3774_001170 [Rhodotorula dairenensis]
MAMIPARMPRSVQPATGGLRLLARRDGAPRAYSSSSAGRSSSRDGTPSPRVKPASPTTASGSASSSTVSPSATESSAPQTRSLSPAPKSTAHAKKRAAAQVNKRAFELPHVRKSLVGLDAFFATHRPLLELPVRLGARRSTAAGGTADSAYVPRDDSTEAARRSSRSGESDLVQVVDQADDGSAVGQPYLVRLSEPEPLRSVEEELAAEAVEEAELAQEEELQHEMEATEDRPYEPWLLGQQDESTAHNVQVARYLAVRPPFTAPAPSAMPSSSSSSEPKELDFLAPFVPAAPLSAASATAPSTTDYSTTFSSHFMEPLSPNEATGAVDRFLSHHEVLYRWSAQSDFVNAAGEALRRAGRAYSLAAPAAEAAPAASGSPVLDALRKQRGSVRLWSDADGFVSIPVGLHLDSSLSPFLPAEDVIVEDIQMDSVKRKRQKKIRKHKHRKRRKAQRALRQKLGK